jgi:hypothetical protein
VVNPWKAVKNGVSGVGRLRQWAVSLQSSKALAGVGTWKSVNQLLVV